MIKNVNESKAEAFKKELECLELLRCIRHSSIIELLASYEQHGDYFLLFPKLSMNLEDFLKMDTRIGEFGDDLTFFNALCGLASAVEVVHELSIESEELIVTRIGYHHDIKPKNILVTENTFVLTDFGLARLNVPDEGSQSQWINTIGDYIAPECMDDKFNHKVVGRSIDVWALGCLIADVATYMELGKDGVQKYRDMRKHTVRPQMPRNYRFFEADALRTSVIGWLNTMSDDWKTCGMPCLVELVTLMLQVDPKVRPKASEVHYRLQYICTKMVYRKILQILQSQNSFFLEKNSTSTPYAQLGSWFEIERIMAWGYVLGMEQDGISHPFFLTKTVIASELYQSLLTALKELRSEAQADKIADSLNTASASVSTSAIAQRLARNLWEKVPVAYQMRMEQAWRQSFLNTDDVPRLHMIEEVARVLPVPYSQIGKAAALKRLSMRIWKEDRDNGSSQQGLLITNRQIQRESKLSETHEIGWLDQKRTTKSKATRTRIFIEWVLYAPSWEEQGEEEKILKTLALAEMLAHPKPETFRVLDCVGVVPPSNETNDPGFGYVYQLPHHIRNQEDISIKTLSELLQNKEIVVLEHKFTLAARICTSMYHLHSASWFHKNLQATNIIFFMNMKDSSNSFSTDNIDPYLVGFQHSRPDGEIWHSDYDVYSGASSQYRHPDYVPGETRFEMKFDYYSLGVLLLEIGFWIPIASFRIKHRDVSKHAFRGLLIERYAPQLRTKMGSLYTNIVITCLKGVFDGVAEQLEGGGIIDAFFWRVVAPLTKIKIS